MKVRTLGKTNIEYGDRSWNLYPGCLHKPAGVCPVPHCWAEGMSKRQCQDFHLPHLVPELLLAPLYVKKPSVILVNFMGDLFGDWVHPDWRLAIPGPLTGMSLAEAVFYVMRLCPQHQFLFLTKAPGNYEKWGQFPDNEWQGGDVASLNRWPDNAWLGATVWNEESMIKSLYALTEARISSGTRLWLSVEPMYGPVVPKVWPAEWNEIGWVVIGAQSNPVKYPEVDWVEDLIMECFKSGKRIWLKKNVEPVLPKTIPFYVPPRDSVSALGIPLGKGKIAMLFRQEYPDAFIGL